MEKELTHKNYPQQLELLHKMIKRLQELKKGKCVTERLKFLLGLTSFSEKIKNKSNEDIVTNFDARFGSDFKKVTNEMIEYLLQEESFMKYDLNLKQILKKFNETDFPLLDDFLKRTYDAFISVFHKR